MKRINNKGLSRFFSFNVALSCPSFGFAAFWAWIQVSFLSRVLSPGATANAGLSFYCHMVSVAMLALSLLIFIRVMRLHHKSKIIGRFFLFGSVLLMSLSVIFQTVSDLESVSGTILILLAGLSSGVGSAFFFIAWGTHFEAAGPRTTILEVSYGFFYAALIYLVVGFLPFLLQVIVTVALPVLSSALLTQAERKTDVFMWEHESASSATQRKQPVELPIAKIQAVRLFVASAVFGLVTGFFRALVIPGEEGVLPESMLPVILSGVGICAIVLTAHAFVKRFDYTWLYRFSFLVVISGLLLAEFIPSMKTLSDTVFMIGIACITTMLWGFLSDIANRNKKKTAAVVGLGMSGLYTGIFLGSLSVFFSSSLIDSATTLVISSTLSIFLLALVCAFVLPERDIESFSEAPGEGVGKWRTMIDAIAQDHRLTQREKEVFILLAQGQTAKKIQDTLHLSTSTVNVHRYHIYEKLGVASKQQLIDFVEAKSY